MPVNNLPAGGILPIKPAKITGTVYIYRPLAPPGHIDPARRYIGWQPEVAGSPLQQLQIIPGETVTFGINGDGGMIGNGTPDTVVITWSNDTAILVRQTEVFAAEKMFRRAAKASAVNGNQAKQVMSTLNAQWFNAVVTGCGLDASTFQLVQGNSPLGSTSESLWNIVDVVPPLSVSHYFNPSELNVFSTDYGGVINNLNPQNAQNFQTHMGDYYSRWMNYLKTVQTVPQGGVLALFYNWSQLNMPPGQAKQCYADWQELSEGVVPVAVQMWLNAGGGTGGVKAYNNTIAALQRALLQVKPKSFTLNTSTQSSDVSHSWAQSEAAGIFDFFEGGGSSSYDQLTTSMSESGLVIDVTFQRLVTFPLGPLSKVSDDPILSQYSPWFSSEALNLAFQNNNNLVWASTPPGWNDTFGPNGNMLRTASALVVVDGVEMTMTCDTGFASAQQTEFKTAAEGGFFPFFEAEGSGGWQHDISFDSNSVMTIKSNCPLNNPSVLGVIVSPIAVAMMPAS